jgi:hypothetical protein
MDSEWWKEDQSKAWEPLNCKFSNVESFFLSNFCGKIVVLGGSPFSTLGSMGKAKGMCIHLIDNFQKSNNQI